MNSYEIFGIIMGVIALVLAIVYIVVPMAIKKGLKLDGYLESADKNIDIIKDAVDTVGKIVPIPQLALIDKILEYADKAVKEAEQLYKIGQIKAEDRKTEAKDYIVHVLGVGGIQVTPEIEKVIDGAIQAGVFVLPKTGWTDLSRVDLTTFPATRIMNADMEIIANNTVEKVTQNITQELNKDGVYTPQSTSDSPSTSNEAVSTVTGSSTTV